MIILGTGRSGSTTLMEMTNELPGYDIAGEHDGILIPLYQAFTLFHENIKNNNKNNITTTSTTETILTKSQYLCWMQDWFYRTAGYKANFTGSDVHGFKEIRYGLDTKLLNFLAMELFPCAKFVVNYRLDIVAQHQSSFQQQVDLDVLTNKTIRLQSFAQQYSKRTFEMPLEYYHNISQWNALFAFLGRPKCVANSVLHANADGGYNVDTRSVVTCHH